LRALAPDADAAQRTVNKLSRRSRRTNNIKIRILEGFSVKLLAFAFFQRHIEAASPDTAVDGNLANFGGELNLFRDKRFPKDLAVRLFLGPSRRRVFKILLASVGRCIEKAVGVGQRFSATRVRRIGVKKIITQTKEYA
jgi:hypothetical protein